ncbi:unnamed protein product [Fraxinus pennsylvanica]|uniref:non-specific serine/threonine protein kinase n=1 Tax=Fraxinus pennsylvanica TaxID=56036 RepID=A0AAD1YXS8_9LAMI|nr:unnamed protein product [Fraxinus pennsylvanica]
MQTAYQFPPAILLVHFLMACLAMATTNITMDQSSLLTFKAHMNLEPSHILSNNWSVSTSVCKWIGVTCDILNHRVTALDISSMNLTGNIPPQLGNLPFLDSLNLSRNDFQGSLPRDFIQLQRLRIVDFGFNSLSGQIPSWFGFLPKLQVLYLRNNSFTGLIPPFLSNISTLQDLDLSFNPLQGKIPEEIGDLHDLRTLKLQYNRLSGVIPSAIFNISTLEILALTGNNLSGEIPSSLSECSQLQLLDLSYNKFSGSIPGEISNLKTLEILRLRSNYLTGAIPQELGNLRNVARLAIGGNFLTGSIPASIFNISSLKYLDISSCNLSGTLPTNMCTDGTHLEVVYLHLNQLYGQLPTRIHQCSKLQILSLTNNSFSGQIPREIGNLTLLTALYASTNKLTGVIPQEIGNLYNLEYLDLGHNYLGGSMPTGFFNLSKLILVTLSHNQLSGNLPVSFGYGLPNLEELYMTVNSFSGRIPDSISNSSKLSIINFSFNNFTGQISNSFGELRFLEILYLNGNNLTSASPELSFISSLTNCRFLRTLSVNGNPLSGILPASVGNMSSSLRFLYAVNCDLRGTIPYEIGNLSNLIDLSLFQNHLTGLIPSTVRNMRSLQALVIFGNKLSGSIPVSICELENLYGLLLQQNQMSGSIPGCIGNLTTLYYLYLDSNRFISGIPVNLWQLKNLLELNLSSNLLSGFIPPEIGNLKVANLVDLSVNQFSGIIPSTVGGLQKLVNLSLANNKLQGSIPDSIGNMLNLEDLDISHNNLSGMIPTSLEALQYLTYLNVSFNRLSGEIPSGGPFKNFMNQSFMFNEGLCGDPRYNVPPCRTISNKRSKRKTMLQGVFIMLGTLALILFLALTYAFVRYRRKYNVLTETDLLSTIIPLRVSYYEIFEATDGYSESNLLGTGSFGSVYRGTLKMGKDVAIKVFNLQLQNAFKSFEVECEVFRNLRHRNLCKVVSSCSNLDFKALVLDYMSNGSLEKWLYSHNYYLDMKQRISIMIDVAAALEYLHHDYSTPIIHCDLKPSNVLLDDDMVAHLSDFGIAKLLCQGECVAHTVTLSTMGYIAPEYGSRGLVSTSCDVYSYGIMLMEVFTRMKPSDETFSGDLSLRSWVYGNVPNAVFQIIDSNLLSSDEDHFHEKLDCLCSIMELALNCSMESSKERINMKNVVATLKKIQNQLLAYYA